MPDFGLFGALLLACVLSCRGWTCSSTGVIGSAATGFCFRLSSSSYFCSAILFASVYASTSACFFLASWDFLFILGRVILLMSLPLDPDLASLKVL